MSDIDQLMENASTALAKMDYLECERLCLTALTEAWQKRRWAYYARILMPLQESRRQRRMIAADGDIRLGTSTLGDDPSTWLDKRRAACIVLTDPHGRAEAAALQEFARRNRRFVEVLLADNPVDADHWMLRSFAGPNVHVQVDAPPKTWRDQWLGTGDQIEVDRSPHKLELHPSDWFLDAGEVLGDAALAAVDPQLKGEPRIEALQQCLLAVTDHEIIHQRLGDVARKEKSESLKT